MQNNKAVLTATLDQFLKSPDFETGIISATKAGWNADLYFVELLPDGHFFVIDGKRLGNKYESEGVILTLPTLDCSDYQELVARGPMDEEEYFAGAIENEREDLEFELRGQLTTKEHAHAE